MALVVINPDDVYEFFRYFKSESAHMINRLLGRNRELSGADSTAPLFSLTEGTGGSSLPLLQSRKGQPIDVHRSIPGILFLENVP